MFCNIVNMFVNILKKKGKLNKCDTLDIET